MRRFSMVRDHRLRQLCAYWLNLRAERWMPRRSEIDPSALPAVLPCLWLYDFLPPDRFRCRLVGEEVKRLFDPSPRGRCLDEIFPRTYAERVQRRFMTMVEQRQASHTLGRCTVAPGREVYAERVALPLSSDGRTVDALIGASSYQFEPHPPAMCFLAEQLETTFIDLAPPDAGAARGVSADSRS
jgi:hypothetical protein